MNSSSLSFPPSLLRPFALLILSVLLAGCIGGGDTNYPSTPPVVAVEDRSTVGNNNTSAASTDQSSTRGTATPSQAEVSKHNVTLALLDKSEAARSQGNLKEAVTHVERAIRINPRRADLWVQLAQLQLALNEPTIAEGYARKAIALAGSRIDWKRDAWLVIADAKQAQGMTGEADAIRQRWRTAQG